MKQKAFTLMELMIVIVIIGILSAVRMVIFGGQAEEAKIAVTKTNHRTATKFIQIEIIKAETTGLVSQWDSINKKCIQVNANSVWHTHGQWAFGCLTEDTGNNKNPFDSTDVAFKGDYSIPTIVGRTNCNWSDVKQTFTCYSRWGTGTNDYETSYINQL